jgi:hypothetical protein
MFDDWLMIHFAPFLNILCIGNTTNFVWKPYIYLRVVKSIMICQELSVCQGIPSGSWAS